MRSMCVGVAETGVNTFLFLSFSFFSDKRKERQKKSFFYVFMKDHWLTLVSSPSLIPDDPKCVPQAIYFGKNHKLKKNVINKESFLLTAGRCPVEKAFKFIFCNRIL